jgi:hypothetical protein
VYEYYAGFLRQKTGKKVPSFIKGIVSWDLCTLVFVINRWYLKFLHIRSMLFKISCPCRISRFLCLGIVSLTCESSWAFSSRCCNPAPNWEPMHYGAHANGGLAENFWRWKLSQSGALCSPVLRASETLISFQCKTNRKISCLWAPDWDRVRSLRWDAKIIKFNTKTKFKKPTKRLHKV